MSQNTLQIIATQCIDEDKEDSNVLYHQVKGFSAEQRRMAYWKCLVVFFISSLRFNKNAQHILYTNDLRDVICDGLDLKKFLQEHGVEILTHKFQYFKPPNGYSTAFKNAFYKLDIIKKLGEQRNTNIDCLLLDADCIWVNNADALHHELQEKNCIFLYDYYTTKDPNPPYLERTRDRHYKKDVGKVYKEIDPNFDVAEPIVFGGEVIAGSATHLGVIGDLLTQSFEYILAKYKNEKELPKFPNGENLFWGMEYWSSLVYNQLPMPWIEMSKYIRRVFKFDLSSANLPEVYQLAIWHLLSEKDRGFQYMYDEIINKKSLFWTSSQEEFAPYAIQFFSTPQFSEVLSGHYPMSIYAKRAFAALKRRWNKQKK
jgi:hypothetical protein